MDNVLTDTDYTMRPDLQSVWITVDGISVYILRTDDGARVELYVAGEEMDEPLDVAYGFVRAV